MEISSKLLDMTPVELRTIILDFLRRSDLDIVIESILGDESIPGEDNDYVFCTVVETSIIRKMGEKIKINANFSILDDGEGAGCIQLDFDAKVKGLWVSTRVDNGPLFVSTKVQLEKEFDDFLLVLETLNRL